MTGMLHHIEPERTGEAGMVGKAAVLWLLILAVLGVGVLDAVSIGRTTLHLSEVATEAAGDGAAAFRTEGRSVTKACEAVAISIEAQDQALKLGKTGCAVDETTGRVAVTLRATADTLVAGRFGPTAEYTAVVVTEANGPSGV
ncbi:MAG: hypothetical protein ACXWXN_01050 [Actinomycetota bacterium]